VHRYSQRLLTQTAEVFTGYSTSDSFAEIDTDISDLLLLVAPFQTPFLNLLPQPPKAATSPKHDWFQQDIGPDRLITSTAINSATAATGVTVNGLAHLLQVGMILELESSAGDGELVQISSIPGPNSILFNRNIGVSPRGVNSLVVGGKLFVVSTAEKEGDDTDGDVSRPRVGFTNYTQIFKKPIRISGTRQAVLTAPNVGSEIDHQETLRTIELLRDLEKAVIRSVAISTIADESTTRTMNGIRAQITTINSALVHSSFVADPLLYTNALMAEAWNAGARDLDVLLMGDEWSAALSSTNSSKLQVEQADRNVTRVVERITTDYGSLIKVVSPWMPRRAMMGVATGRIFVPNLQGRSFKREELAKTGDNLRRHILGEYTTEVHHQEQMFQARST
jgi:hypothetical protein